MGKAVKKAGRWFDSTIAPAIKKVPGLGQVYSMNEGLIKGAKNILDPKKPEDPGEEPVVPVPDPTDDIFKAAALRAKNKVTGLSSSFTGALPW